MAAGDGRRRVAVVGAGPSGIATVKELLEEGHEPTCFERTESIGGVYRFDEESGVVWDSFRLASSGVLTAFSDFPVPPERAGHMTAEEYVDYLQAYCAEFGVDERIRFGTTVESVERAGDGWLVCTTDRAGSRSEERFDAVAVCSGLNQRPRRTEFPGQETFPGKLLHGAAYRRPAQVAGKRVLVVGAGESGADIVAEVCEHAAEAVLSLRRGVGVLPRTVRGHPNDYLTTRLGNSAAHWVFETRNPSDEWKRRVYKIVFLPFVVVDKLVQTAARLVAKLRRQGSATRATGRLAQELLAASGGTLQEQLVTKSDDFVRAIATGRCRRAEAIARCDGSRVVFDDGSSCEPDVVILCTGFEGKASFLDDALAEAPRYLHTFVPSVGARLGFIGFMRPGFGATPPLAELQARWFALLLSGKAELPSEAEMQAAIDRLAGFRTHYFRAVRGRLDHVVDYTSICDELAAMIGCKPTRAALRRESRRFRVHFLVSPFVAAQYRLVGPHAKPALARKVIEELPVAQPLHAVGAYWLRWRLSQVLHRVLGSQFAPKLVVR